MIRNDTKKRSVKNPDESDVQSCSSSKPSDEVLLETTRTPLPFRDKLSPRWMGPFRVLAKTAPSTYRLDLPPSRSGVPSRSSTWNACVATSAARLRWAAMTRSQLQFRASTVNWSMRWRLSSKTKMGCL